MGTSHWTWDHAPVAMPGRDEPVSGGKKNTINNFCISVTSNWPPCTACHAGYGWVDDTYDFEQADHVDCLVCHDNSGLYVKANGGTPAEGVDLVAAAQSVGGPTRENCGGCHFRGGGGDAVKHGDLDESLYFPSETVDVHMGKHDMLCTDCHRVDDHAIRGRSISVSLDDADQAYCTDCHDPLLHEDERITDHLGAVACQTCHIPHAALREATKTHWDWSAAGQDLPEDPHEYLKIKGQFVYEEQIVPNYFWYSGTADRYLLGDKLDPTEVTSLNTPRGDIDDPDAVIFPFKLHTARQIYDTEHDYLLPPKTAGEGGYWTDFDWDQAARLGAAAAGLPYSGSFDFTDTVMFWPITHMVAPAERSLQCVDCHGEDGSGRMNWEALGYPGDPIHFGGRDVGPSGDESTPQPRAGAR
jgi:octaheme c-type cytochrome (tetrathionate reductase family)